jgi:SPP1 family predicted phage head-tail adaptor
MVLTQAGKRRHYLTIQVGTETEDGQGGSVTTWVSTYYEWGRAMTLSQSRALEQGGIKYKTAVEFTIRKRSDYTLSGASHRILWDGNYYTIHSVVPSEKMDDLTVTAYN